MELLESVKILQKLNFKLFASIGTADFYNDHGVKVGQVCFVVRVSDMLALHYCMHDCVFTFSL